MKDIMGWMGAVVLCVAMALGGLAMVIMVRDIAGWAKPSTRTGATECKCGGKTQEAAR